MKEKLLALLLTAFSGVRKDGLTVLAGSLALTAKTEEEATAAVGKLTADDVNQFITDWRKDADREISNANTTYEKSLKTKYDFVEKKTEEPNPTPPTPPTGGALDAEAIAKIIADSQKPLLERLARFEDGNTLTTRKDALTLALKDAPKSHQETVLKGFERASFKDDEDFNTYLEEIKQGASAATQEHSNAGLGVHSRPEFSTKTADGVSTGVAEYLKEKSAESNTTGKEI